jgi:hypothetical protein
VNPGTVAPLSLAFFASFLVVGVPYWSIPLNQLELPRDIWGFGLVASAAFAVAASVLGRVRAWGAGLAVAAAAPSAVLVRVIFDVARDSSTHNLWPFEVALALGPGLLAGLAGTLVSALIARLRGT